MMSITINSDQYEKIYFRYYESWRLESWQI